MAMLGRKRLLSKSYLERKGGDKAKCIDFVIKSNAKPVIYLSPGYTTKHASVAKTLKQAAKAHFVEILSTVEELRRRQATASLGCGPFKMCTSKELAERKELAAGPEADTTRYVTWASFKDEFYARPMAGIFRP